MPVQHTADLREQIAALKHKEQTQRAALIEQFYEAKETLRPMNLLKSTFNEIVESPHLVSKLTDASIGLGAGFLSKKILIGNSGNLFKKMIGNLVELGVAGVVSNHTEPIKKAGIQLLGKWLSKRKKPQDSTT